MRHNGKTRRRGSAPAGARQNERLRGLGYGLAIIAGAFLLMQWLAARSRSTGGNPELALFLFVTLPSLGLLGWGLLMWRKARRIDHRNYATQKATPMPLRLAATYDDIWTEGRIFCPDPVRVRNFRLRVAWYRLVVEKSLRPREPTRWVEVARFTRSAPTWLQQGEALIRLDLGRARFDHMPTVTRTAGRRRYVVTYLRRTHRVSASGVIRVARDERTLSAAGSVPLVITPLTRHEWYALAEAEEARPAVLSSLLVFGGLTGALWSGGTLAGLWPGRDVFPFVLSTATAFLLTLTLIALSTYNRMVAYRQRLKNAWSQIQVCEKMRHELIPKLAEAVAAYAEHEAETLARVAGARGPEESRRHFLRLREAYPELASSDVFERLSRELTALEEKIAFARRFFAEVVREYHDLIGTFPNVLFAGPLGFRRFRT